MLLRKYLEHLHLDAALINALRACFTAKQYEKQAYFASAGELADKLGFVVSGVFGMFHAQEDGTLFVKDFIAPEQFLLATFDPAEESTAYIQAIQDACILEARYSAIQRLLQANPAAAALAQTGMQRRFNALIGRLESFVTLDATARYQIFKQEYGRIEEQIPQYLIASYLGITPTQLSRIRRK